MPPDDIESPKGPELSKNMKEAKAAMLALEEQIRSAKKDDPAPVNLDAAKKAILKAKAEEKDEEKPLVKKAMDECMLLASMAGIKGKKKIEELPDSYVIPAKEKNDIITMLDIRNAMKPPVKKGPSDVPDVIKKVRSSLAKLKEKVEKEKPKKEEVQELIKLVEDAKKDPKVLADDKANKYVQRIDTFIKSLDTSDIAESVHQKREQLKDLAKEVGDDDYPIDSGNPETEKTVDEIEDGMNKIMKNKSVQNFFATVEQKTQGKVKAATLEFLLGSFLKTFIANYLATSRFEAAQEIGDAMQRRMAVQFALSPKGGALDMKAIRKHMPIWNESYGKWREQAMSAQRANPPTDVPRVPTFIEIVKNDGKLPARFGGGSETKTEKAPDKPKLGGVEFDANGKKAITKDADVSYELEAGKPVVFNKEGKTFQFGERTFTCVGTSGAPGEIKEIEMAPDKNVKNTLVSVKFGTETRKITVQKLTAVTATDNTKTKVKWLEAKDNSNLKLES